MFTILIALALAGPDPRVLDAPRKAYTTCLKSFETRSLADKIDASAYSSALKSACSAEAAALARALIAYDVAMGGKRASATTNADNDIADYRLTSEERYRDLRPDKAP